MLLRKDILQETVVGGPVRFSLHMAESVVREIQKTKRSVIVLRSQFLV